MSLLRDLSMDILVLFNNRNIVGKIMMGEDIG